MKTPLLILAALLALSSCRSVQFHKHKKKEEHRVKVDSVATSHTTITETLDTGIVLPPDTLTGSIKLTDLLAGDSIDVETDAGTLIVKLDPVTKKLKARSTRKPKTVPVKINKTTTTDNRTAVKRDESHKAAEKVKDVEREPSIKGSIGFWATIFLVVGILFGFWWLTNRFGKK
jgi:hypothetical protein